MAGSQRQREIKEVKDREKSVKVKDREKWQEIKDREIK